MNIPDSDGSIRYFLLIITDLGGCFLITAESRGGGTESHRVLTVFSAVLYGHDLSLMHMLCAPLCPLWLKRCDAGLISGLP